MTFWHSGDYVILFYSECYKENHYLDLKPRMKRNYRGHAASLWLNLVPALDDSGSWDSRVAGPHGMLTGDTWGLVRNRTTVPGVQQISGYDKVDNDNDLIDDTDLLMLGSHLQSRCGDDCWRIFWWPSSTEPDYRHPRQSSRWHSSLHCQHCHFRRK